MRLERINDDDDDDDVENNRLETNDQDPTKNIIYENHQALIVNETGVNPNNTSSNSSVYSNNRNFNKNNLNNNSQRAQSFQTLPNIGSSFGIFRNSTKKIHKNRARAPLNPTSEERNLANMDVGSNNSRSLINDLAIFTDALRKNDESIDQVRKQIESVAAQFEIIVATARTVEIKVLKDMIDQLDSLQKTISVCWFKI